MVCRLTQSSWHKTHLVALVISAQVGGSLLRQGPWRQRSSNLYSLYVPSPFVQTSHFLLIGYWFFFCLLPLKSPLFSSTELVSPAFPRLLCTSCTCMCISSDPKWQPLGAGIFQSPLLDTRSALHCSSWLSWKAGVRKDVCSLFLQAGSHDVVLFYRWWGVCMSQEGNSASISELPPCFQIKHYQKIMNFTITFFLSTQINNIFFNIFSFWHPVESFHENDSSYEVFFLKK